MIVNPSETYSVPLKLKLLEAWHDTWHALLLLIPCLLITACLTVANGVHGEGMWAMYLFCGIVFTIIAWAIFWAMKRGHVRYEIGGITFLFTDPDYYIPPKDMLKFVSIEVWRKFKPFNENPSDMTRGVLVIFETEPHARVLEANGKVKVKRVLGATQPWSRYSRVTANRALDPGVCGYELQLHCCQFLFPGRSEAEDIEWMIANGVA